MAQALRAKILFLLVRQASKVKGIKVVSYDWLEDSLLSKSPKREGPYLMDRQAKSVAKSRAKKKATRKRNLREGGEVGADLL